MFFSTQKTNPAAAPPTDYLKEYQRLRNSLPRAAIGQIQHENSDFCNYIDRVKDCYLIVSAMESERCFYGRNLFFDLDCVDCNDVHNSELCYECIGLKKCYNCNNCQECEQCIDCGYCSECKGCQNCFLCTNLRHKKFCIFNHQYTRKDYEEQTKNLKSSDHLHPQFLTKKFEEILTATPQISTHGHNNENSTGDYIFNNQNVHACFETKECRDCAYSWELFKCEDSVDVLISEFGKLNYDCVSAYKLYNSNFCYNCWESSNLEYCEQCFQCDHCLFCVYLKHKRFYIFNKPYPESEYFLLKSQIIKEMKSTSAYAHEQLPSTYPIKDSMLI